MSFDTFANLKLEILDWSQRNDMAPRLDSFITLTEKDMFKATRSHESLQIRGQETTSNANVSTKFFALPDEYHSFRSIRLVLDTLNGRLTYKAPDALFRRSGTGRPSFFTVGSQIEFDITPDTTYDVEVNYFKKPTPLSDTNTSNIILAEHPDIYLHGALSQLFTLAKDQESANFHKGLYDEAIDGANQSDKEGRYGPAPYARVEGSTP